MEQDSALTPREIQARIRAGESAYEVARAAGVPIERIEPFAAPVLAEREHIARLAQACQVRRAVAEPGSRRPLADVIGDRLTAQGIFPEALAWDAWRGQDRLWTVRVSYASGAAAHEALFTFDQRGRFSVPANSAGRLLIGDDSAPATPAARTRRRVNEPDEEPTLDLHDDSAPARPLAAAQGWSAPPGFPAADEVPAFGHGHDEAIEPADFAPAELAEVDGVYDLVPARHSELDVLYDMLSDLDEDSVNLYEGLTKGGAAPTGSRPAAGRAPAAAASTPAAPQPAGKASPKAAKASAKAAAAPSKTAKTAPPPASVAPVAPSAGRGASAAQPAAQPSAARQPGTKPAASAQATTSAKAAAGGKAASPTPVQTAAPATPAVPEPAAGAAEPAAKPRAKKRAVVPSAWDDILFGARKQ